MDKGPYMTEPKLMPFIQAFSAIFILILFAVITILPMFGFHQADPAMVETEKAIMLILIGWLFGSSASGARKDAANAALLNKVADVPKSNTVT
jgi:ABC-type nickel/cobalt efflux system permease component RcnA